MNTKCFYIGLAILTLVFVPFGFTEDFQSRPGLSELNELVNQGIVSANAVRERDLVVNRNVNYFPYCGPWQPYVASLQSELEYLPPSYVDHVNGPLNASQNNFLFFTLSTWQAAAGLSTNGFRRVTAPGNNAYGHAQEGDMLGPWIYEDLQQGYSALQQAVWGNYTIEYKRKQVMTGQQAQTPEQLRQTCIAQWNAASWESCGYVAVRAEASGVFFQSYTHFGNMEAYREAWKVTLLFPAGFMERSVDEYFQTQVYGTFYDIDGFGLEGQGILTRIKEIPAFSETSKELEWIGEGDDVCPWALIEEGLPVPPPDYSRNYAYRGGTAYIVKPNFTHQNH